MTAFGKQRGIMVIGSHLLRKVGDGLVNWIVVRLMKRMRMLITFFKVRDAVCRD